tara:strand:+ start:241 stop:705 length:465 start_codon:yes stop_codon:yes gene_type:complete
MYILPYLLIIALFSLYFYIYIKSHNCKFHSTSDPRIFGRKIWPAFHIMAHNYPNSPSEQTRKSCIKLIESIPHMLPCSHCGCNFNKFLKKYDLNKVCSTKNSLVNFFVMGHNDVSKHVHPNRKKWTVNDANKKYSKEYKCLYNNIPWAGCNLTR